ncbi:hypothetical protein IJ750_06990 [bacterium]|nr:hypothetical protein [bacterium]
MSEINGPKFGVNQVNFNSVQKQGQEIPAEAIENDEQPKLKDFSDPKAEALGRSMLIKDADNTNHDLKTLIDNPQIAENSDEMFETAFKAAQDAGVENPYEEAASFSTGNM